MKMSNHQSNTRSFHVLDVLTIITGRLVSTKGISAIYDILSWITQSEKGPFTHELTIEMDRCRPLLLKWFPELKPTLASGKSLDQWTSKSPTHPDVGVKMWLTELQMMFPEIKDTYYVPQINLSKMTVDELSRLIGKCLEYLDLQGITRLHPPPESYKKRPIFSLCLMDFDSILERAASDERVFPLKRDKWNVIFNRMGQKFLIHRSEEVNSSTVEVSFTLPKEI